MRTLTREEWCLIYIWYWKINRDWWFFVVLICFNFNDISHLSLVEWAVLRVSMVHSSISFYFVTNLLKGKIVIEFTMWRFVTKETIKITDHIHWRAFRIDLSLLYAVLCMPNNFKPIFYKDKVRSWKIHVQESYRELNSLSNSFLNHPIKIHLIQSKFFS